MSSPIDLSQLPAPDVVETLDYEDILAERKARLIELTPEADRADVAATLELESEPITKLLQENAYRELNWRQRVNEAARAVMLAYANDDDLDNLVANTNVERLVINEGDPDATPPVPASYESNTELRLRAQEAWEGLSVAGPQAAYEFHARSADGRVADVRAISPQPCDALLTILSREGDGTADQELLDIVYAAVTPEDVRPVADRVTVQSAEIIDYAIDAELQLYSDAGTTQEPILAAANARLTRFVEAQHRQRRRLGVSVYRDAIKAALHVEGVEHVKLNSPADHIIIAGTQAARCTAKAVAISDEGGNDE
ncbi:baseplate assembly protein [Chromohalobacter israelensis]|uniref:baseplate assembly protein n=1 Tax=Chromohalobacter israelensis TaxID=141390 RepID=UPI0005535C90|nr:baseplate J/gp47 family protein [Chromohalobacter israelensis]MDF9433022.1 baseplate J/gp47 family protein [Chromohalobacter israelensis]